MLVNKPHAIAKMLMQKGQREGSWSVRDVPNSAVSAWPLDNLTCVGPGPRATTPKTHVACISFSYDFTHS